MLNPNDDEAFVDRGNAYAKKGNYDYAISDYNKALKINPNNTNAYFYRGINDVLKRDKNRARQDFIKAKSLGHPDAQECLDLLDEE